MSKWKDTSNHWSKTSKRADVLSKVVKCLIPGRNKPHTEETKKKISETKKGVSVWGGSRETPWMEGKNNPNWKGGISDKISHIRKSKKYKDWAKAVYKRDYWTCQGCGKKCGKDIIAHHLKAFADYEDLRFDIDNGITVCRSCHKKIHKNIGIETRFKSNL